MGSFCKKFFEPSNSKDICILYPYLSTNIELQEVTHGCSVDYSSCSISIRVQNNDKYTYEESVKSLSVSDEGKLGVGEERSTPKRISEEQSTHESSSPIVHNEDKTRCDHTQQSKVEELDGTKYVSDCSTCTYSFLPSIVDFDMSTSFVDHIPTQMVNNADQERNTLLMIMRHLIVR